MESEHNIEVLAKKGIENGICPKSPMELREKMSEESYAAGQRRRASTEGRIAIFKNKILGGILRAKGFSHRRRAVAWGVLAHNLWVLGRLQKVRKEEANRHTQAHASQASA